MESNSLRAANPTPYGDRLLRLGVLLFLLGLLTGFAVPALTNPRMGLTSHLEGLMNGMFLVLLGLVWSRLALSPRSMAATFWIALYGTFANWAGTLLAAAWGTGRTTPLAAPGRSGTPVQEGVVDFLLISLSLAMVAVSCLVLWGLRSRREEPVRPIGA
ncbi:MAG TPA: hydrogenase [Thermoanaerobaculia bacterium]|jgi:hydroxylaminobenzene mutase|nr:hydrogenase [Thermoanaerobaculia bacterium]